MQELATLGSYWDEIAKKALPNGKLRDNWEKRREILRRLLQYDFEDTKILEIGCGLGVTAAGIKLNTVKFHYVATDTSPIFAERLVRVLGHNGYIAKATDLPFQDGEKNILFLFDTLEHIHPDEREQSYKEMRRVLNDKFLIFINNPLSESLHNKQFDHGFKTKDLLCMCTILGARIMELQEYNVKDNNYQFIVLIAE